MIARVTLAKPNWRIIPLIFRGIPLSVPSDISETKNLFGEFHWYIFASFSIPFRLSFSETFRSILIHQQLYKEDPREMKREGEKAVIRKRFELLGGSKREEKDGVEAVAVGNGFSQYTSILDYPPLPSTVYPPVLNWELGKLTTGTRPWLPIVFSFSPSPHWSHINNTFHHLRLFAEKVQIVFSELKNPNSW